MKTTKTQNRFVYRRTGLLLTLVLSLFLLPPSLWGQVTVGADEAPQDFSILEVVSNKKGGLRLPRLDIDQRTLLEQSAAFLAEKTGKAKGLTIYNTTNNCVETWNGSQWIGLCADNVIPPTIGMLTCGTNSITVTQGAAVSSDNTFSILYSDKTGANITLTNNQILGSVTNGLTVVANGAQSLSASSGNIAIKVIGTPTTIGTFTLSYTIGGKSCIISVTSNAPYIGSITCSSVTGVTVTQGAAANIAKTLPYSGKVGSGISLADNAVLGTANGLSVQVDGEQTLSAASSDINIKVTGTATTTGTISIPVTVAGAGCNINVSSLSPGTGTFTGKTCFDLVFSNDKINSCAPKNSRTGHKTDFANIMLQDPDPNVGTGAAPYSGVQVYTFTPTGKVSNVRFDYVDASGKVIESISGGNSGNSITGVVKATVTYKASLNDDLKGLTRGNALKADIYAIYNDGASNNGTDRMVKLTAVLQDCNCCGAATISGGWLNFMCHNLGADESLDPFTYVFNGDAVGNDIKGDLYQWGRPKDGHEKRGSTVITTLATSNTPGHGNFISISSTPYDWRSGGGNTSRWGDGTTNENMARGTNDPCPEGWKVPSQKQWASIFREDIAAGSPSTATANIWTWTTSGFKVGDALFLPAADSRNGNNGLLSSVGSGYGYYWSSTAGSTFSYRLNFTGSNINPANSTNRAFGLSVRCVEE